MKIGRYRIKIESPGELVVPIVATLFAVMYLKETLRLYSTNAMVLIKWVILGIFVFAGIVVLKQVRVRGAVYSEDSTTSSSIALTGDSLRILYFVAATFANLFFLRRAGYVVTFGLYTAATMFLLGVRRVTLLLCVPAGLILFIYLLFQRWLMVPLPMGIWWQ